MKRLGAVATGLVLLLGGCAGAGPDAKENPKEALISAFEKLPEREGHEITLSLDATVESLQALGSSQPGGTGMSDDDAAKILESQIQVLTKGKGPDAQIEMVATIAGEEDLTIKVVDQNLYLQADAEGLAQTFGADPAELEQAAKQADAQGLDFVRPALEGEWIAITGFQELQEQLGGPSQEEMEQQQERFIRDMTDAMRDTAEVEHVGDEDAGEHLAVTLPIRDLYSRMMEALQASLGPAGGLSPLPQAAEVPDESVVLDVWVEDDSVTQVAFDLTQVEDLEGDRGSTSDGGRAILLIELEEFTEDVQPPDDAVEVEAQRLFELFGSMMMPGAGGAGGMPGGTGGMPGGTGTTGEFDCTQLEGAPPAVLEQFADECPELQAQ